MFATRATLPGEWPPVVDSRFASIQRDGTRLDIWIDVEGRFSIVVARPDALPLVFTFQPIQPVGYGHVYFECSWDSEKPFLQIQSAQLALYEFGNDAPLFINVTPGLALTPHQPLYDHLE